MVCAAVATLAWIRFTDRGEPIALFQASAFLVLVVANAMALLLVLAALGGLPGVSSEATGAWPLWVAALSRLAAASLLVAGGIASLRRTKMRLPRLIALGPALGVLLLIVVAASISPALPPLSDPFAPVLGDTGSLPGSTPSGNALGVLVHLPAFALFLWAAALSRRLYLRDGNIGEAYLAVGLVFAAFAQSGLALDPGTYPGVVAGGDLLRLAFDVTLLLGIEAETRATVGSPARGEPGARAAQGCRGGPRGARGARQAVPGAARRAGPGPLGRQAQGRPAGRAARPWPRRDRADRRARRCDRRRSCGGPPGGDGDALRRRDRPVLLRADGALRRRLRRPVRAAGRVQLRAGLPRLAPRVEAELLRIAQEALNNVRRHADATFVRVQAAVDAESLALWWTDNGRGFDPATVGDSAYGLASMRERATLIGGQPDRGLAPAGRDEGPGRGPAVRGRDGRGVAHRERRARRHGCSGS